MSEGEFTQDIFEAGVGVYDARASDVELWSRLGRSTGVFLAAAVALGTRTPQSLEESVEETERRPRMRKMLGVTAGEAQLEAAFRAHVVLGGRGRELGWRPWWRTLSALATPAKTWST